MTCLVLQCHLQAGYVSKHEQQCLEASNRYARLHVGNPPRTDDPYRQHALLPLGIIQPIPAAAQQPTQAPATLDTNQQQQQQHQQQEQQQQEQQQQQQQQQQMITHPDKAQEGVSHADQLVLSEIAHPSAGDIANQQNIQEDTSSAEQNMCVEVTAEGLTAAVDGTMYETVNTDPTPALANESDTAVCVAPNSATAEVTSAHQLNNLDMWKPQPTAAPAAPAAPATYPCEGCRRTFPRGMLIAEGTGKPGSSKLLWCAVCRAIKHKPREQNRHSSSRVVRAPVVAGRGAGGFGARGRGGILAGRGFTGRGVLRATSAAYKAIAGGRGRGRAAGGARGTARGNPPRGGGRGGRGGRASSQTTYTRIVVPGTNADDRPTAASPEVQAAAEDLVEQADVQHSARHDLHELVSHHMVRTYHDLLVGPDGRDLLEDLHYINSLLDEDADEQLDEQPEQQGTGASTCLLVHCGGPMWGFQGGRVDSLLVKVCSSRPDAEEATLVVSVPALKAALAVCDRLECSESSEVHSMDGTASMDGAEDKDTDVGLMSEAAGSPGAQAARLLLGLLSDGYVTKMVYDARKVAGALTQQLGCDLVNILDLQLLELLTRRDENEHSRINRLSPYITKQLVQVNEKYCKDLHMLTTLEVLLGQSTPPDDELATDAVNALLASSKDVYDAVPGSITLAAKALEAAHMARTTSSSNNPQTEQPAKQFNNSKQAANSSVDTPDISSVQDTGSLLQQLDKASGAALLLHANKEDASAADADADSDDEPPGIGIKPEELKHGVAANASASAAAAIPSAADGDQQSAHTHHTKTEAGSDAEAYELKALAEIILLAFALQHYEESGALAQHRSELTDMSDRYAGLVTDRMPISLADCFSLSPILPLGILEPVENKPPMYECRGCQRSLPSEVFHGKGRLCSCCKIIDIMLSQERNKYQGKLRSQQSRLVPRGRPVPAAAAADIGDQSDHSSRSVARASVSSLPQPVDSDAVKPLTAEEQANSAAAAASYHDSATASVTAQRGNGEEPPKKRRGYAFKMQAADTSADSVAGSSRDDDADVASCKGSVQSPTLGGLSRDGDSERNASNAKTNDGNDDVGEDDTSSLESCQSGMSGHSGAGGADQQKRAPRQYAFEQGNGSSSIAGTASKSSSSLSAVVAATDQGNSGAVAQSRTSTRHTAVAASSQVESGNKPSDAGQHGRYIHAADLDKSSEDDDSRSDQQSSIRTSNMTRQQSGNSKGPVEVSKAVHQPVYTAVAYAPDQTFSDDEDDGNVMYRSALPQGATAAAAAAAKPMSASGFNKPWPGSGLNTASSVSSRASAVVSPVSHGMTAGSGHVTTARQPVGYAPAVPSSFGNATAKPGVVRYCADISQDDSDEDGNAAGVSFIRVSASIPNKPAAPAAVSRPHVGDAYSSDEDDEPPGL